jgi:uncharacterized membrane protein YdbT with pleckstrin-like domain
MATDNSAFSLWPVFIGWITLLIQLPLQLFFTFWSGGFFGGMSSSFLALNSRVPFIVFGAAAFVSIPVVAYVGKKLNYARTEYRFYSDRLEFDEGFFSINKKVIKFRDVKEVTLRKGVLQRIYGLGTIYLATLATGSTANFNPLADSSLKGNTISPHWKGWCDGRRLHTTDGCGAGEDRAWTT